MQYDLMIRDSYTFQYHEVIEDDYYIIYLGSEHILHLMS